MQSGLKIELEVLRALTQGLWLLALNFSPASYLANIRSKPTLFWGQKKEVPFYLLLLQPR